MRRFVVYRKPSVNFTKTFEEIVTLAKSSSNREKDFVGMSFICEAFPKNAFARVDSRGVFRIYYIHSDGKVHEGNKCIFSLKLTERMWTVTMKLDDVFAVLNTDDGSSISLKEALEFHVNRVNTYRKNNNNNTTKEYTKDEISRLIELETSANVDDI